MKSPEEIEQLLIDCTEQIEILQARVTELESKTGTRKPKKRNTNIPPNIEDVRAYCTERSNGIDPNQWYDFYVSKNWMIGKNKMVNWKAAVRTWERNLPGKTVDPDFNKLIDGAK